MKKVSVGDIELNVLDRGSGSPLLLVHGFPLDHTMWSAQAEEFAASHRVLVPDLRGFGRSGVTSGVVTMDQMADDCAALLAALSIHEPVVFCGLSMGGYIAWQFVLKYPHLVRGLVLADTRAVADTPEAAANRRKVADHVLRSGSTAALAEAMLPKLVAPETTSQQPEVVERLQAMIAAAPPEGVAAAQLGMAERPDVTKLLGDIHAPSLVIVGEHDAIASPEEMEQIAEDLPDSHWVVVPEAGHMAPMENAPAFNHALREFLTTVEGKTGPGIIQPEEA